MQFIPQELLALVQKVASPAAEVLPLPWAYEHEDYNIAVVVPDTVTYEEARQLEGRLIDAVMDYDSAHGTFTLCMVWHEREKRLAGIR